MKKNEKGCPFCGSKEIYIKTPYVELNKKGEYSSKTTICCGAQRKNQTYIEKRFNPIDNSIPSAKEVSKW